MKRFIIEIGTGIDQHGQDATNAAKKAVRDAISRNYLTGLREIAGTKGPHEMLVDVLIAAPNPAEVDTARVLEALPFGKKSIKVMPGGMIVQGGLPIAELGETSGEIIVVNAAVTVGVEG